MSLALERDVFSSDYLSSVKYVHAVSNWGADEIYGFLQSVYHDPECALAKKSIGEIAGGLKAISYSGGFQWRLLGVGSGIDLPAKLCLLEGSFTFFRGYLACDEKFRDACLMWWDDVAARLRYDEPTGENADESSIEEFVLRGKVLEILVRGMSIRTEQGQMACLNGFDALNHPRTAEIVSYFITSGDPVNQLVLQQARTLT
jgi:hypothetical protein